MAACLGAVILVAAVFIAARGAIGQSFTRIEADAAEQGAERVHRALEGELHRIELTAQSYAALWAETQGRHGFSRRELDQVGIDTVWVTGEAGETAWEVAVDDASPHGVGVIPGQTLTVLKQHLAAVVTSRDPLERRVGLLRMSQGVMAVAAVPILGDGASGRKVGMLVFGRHLDGNALSRLEHAARLPVRITLLNERGEPTGTVPAAVADWLAVGAVAPDILVQTDNPARLGGHTLLRDIDGRPLAVLSTSVTRAALAGAQRTIAQVMSALMAGSALLAILLLVLMNRSWRAHTRVQVAKQRRELSRVARRDPLTGLPNRLHLQKVMPRLLLRARREGSQLALFYLDLDHFKDVNDSLGHIKGDQLLAAVARRLRAAVPRHDPVVRMGGDEFVVIATMVPDAEAVSSIAADIRSALALPFEVDGGGALAVSPSVGISVYPADGDDPEQLLRHADIALYHAKDLGRGTHQFYNQEMNTRLRERFDLERALRQALDRDELSVEYQPCYDLQTLRPVSLEALLRWRGPEGTLVPPSRFIPIAEQSNLIVELGEWVLHCVCHQLAVWQREQLPLIPVSVNISVRQFERTALASDASTLAQELGIDVNLLHFEITEHAAMQYSQQHLGFLQALRNLGSRILIDDFGTGYSSLSHLKNLPIDTLKIDRAFVRDMATNQNDAAIVRTIVLMAKSLGLAVVAEGIESQEQLNRLRELGCDCGQGFYFSPAVSADSCRNLLRGLRGPRTADGPRLVAMHQPS